MKVIGRIAIRAAARGLAGLTMGTAMYVKDHPEEVKAAAKRVGGVLKKAGTLAYETSVAAAAGAKKAFDDLDRKNQAYWAERIENYMNCGPVVVSNFGKYHNIKRGCQYSRNMRGPTFRTVREAQESGYTACSKCHWGKVDFEEIPSR